MARKRWPAVVGIGLAVLAAAVVVFLVLKPRVAELIATGDSRQLRPASGPPSEPARPDALVIALDGVGRDLIHGLLAAGELPGLARLLGGRRDDGTFPHAFFAEDVLSVLPSTTIAAWASAFTGVPPGVHGVSGNEFFVREERWMSAPAAVSIDDVAPILAVYTDGAADRWLEAPTVYEQLRAPEPGIRIWVAMSQFYRGADRLLLASRTALADAFAAFLRASLPDQTARPLYAELDEEVVETVIDELEERPAPDVLTVYLPGADLFAHHAHVGPDEARRGYLRDVLDPLFVRLEAALRAHGALDDRFVVVTSDHGHTDVLHDEAHALGTGEGDPPEVLRKAGFRVRPFEWKVPAEETFDAVLAYQGAMAYVYLADRSTCPPCDFAAPPRFEEDVVPAAEAFLAATRRGEGVPALRGALELVLARRPAPPGAPAPPYQVYAGGGELVPVDAWLAEHPKPAWLSFAERIRLLSEGPHGDRAGDVLLVARNDDDVPLEERRYFASEYRSWHGSAGAKDSRVPLIVGHPGREAEELRELATEALGPAPLQTALTHLLLRLRRAESR